MLLTDSDEGGARFRSYAVAQSDFVIPLIVVMNFQNFQHKFCTDFAHSVLPFNITQWESVFLP